MGMLVSSLSTYTKYHAFFHFLTGVEWDWMGCRPHPTSYKLLPLTSASKALFLQLPPDFVTLI